MDVKQAEINPFYHYIVAGKAEGRLPQRPGSTRRQRIEDQIPPRSHAPVGPDLSSERKLTVQILSHLLESKLADGSKIVFSLSHDCYIRSIGGTQIFISDEANLFLKNQIHYLHVSPTQFAPYFRAERDDYLLQVVLNNEYLGLISALRLKEVFNQGSNKTSRLYAIVHVALGHNPELLSDIILAFSPKQTYVWLHDYSTICCGFNLLRNDVEFCGAPKLNSMACRVCSYGAERSEHLRQVSSIFSKLNPIAIAPSESAAEIWYTAKNLDCDEVLIIPHVDLVRGELEPCNHFALGTGWDPIKVAFVGYPSFHKGWETFELLLDNLSSDPRYIFYHFASNNSRTLRSDLKFRTVEVSASNRFAAVSALTDEDIDIVINASVWPETFSYVAFESAAAGALTFTVQSSGNVAAMVREQRNGKVFKDANEMLSYLSDGSAILDVRSQFSSGRQRFDLDRCGTTAALLEQDKFAAEDKLS